MTATRRLFVGGSLPSLAAAAPQARVESAPPDSVRLRAAVASGDLPAISSLLGRDPALAWLRDERGVSMYILACLNQHKEAAELLLARGLVLDIFEAAAGGRMPRVQELLKTNPDSVNLRLPDGRTPMHLAAAAGQADIVVHLYGAGADLSAGPESPLLAALDGPDATAAMVSAQALVANGSDPNARRKDGATALHLAAARGYADTVRLLVHRGADPEARDASGRTPLQVATGDGASVLRGAASIERAFYGRRFPQTDDGSGLPQSFINLFVGLAHRDVERVKHLHKLCPALLNARATFDEIAIEAASHMGLTALASYLADAGGLISTCTATLLGQTTIVKTNLREEPRCLYERGPHDLPVLAYTAFGEPRVDIAEMLLTSGADVRVRAFGQTVLHIAALKGHVELARLLLERGADVNATVKTRDGEITPLALAVRSGKNSVTDLLRAYGGRAIP